MRLITLASMSFVSVLALGTGCGDDTGGTGGSGTSNNGGNNTGASNTGGTNTGGMNTGGNNGGSAGDGGNNGGSAGDGGSTGGDGGGSTSVECGELCELIGESSSSASACMSQNLQMMGYNVIAASEQCAGITADEAACNGCTTTLEVTPEDCGIVVGECF